jgi:hypothetical protein
MGNKAALTGEKIRPQQVTEEPSVFGFETNPIKERKTKETISFPGELAEKI